MTNATRLTPDQVKQAREWIAECAWPDLDEDMIAELTDRQVERGIARHFDGGIASFIASCE